jgi:DNA helicase-2/ATP-dependent DNA helicase PcrA
LARFFDIVRSHEALFPQGRLPQLVEYLELLRLTGDSPSTVESEHDRSAVSVMTIHASKGLEFPAVFLVGLSARRFPSWRREDPLEFPAELMACPNADHIAEERRLFYVALTRAQRFLWLSMAFDEGTRRSQQISPFLREALADRNVDYRPARRSTLEELMRHSAPPPDPIHNWSTLPRDKPLRLSWKKLDLYWTCPRKYFYSEVLQLSAPTTHQASYGQAVHEAVTTLLNQKMEGIQTSLEEVLTAFATRWKRAGYLSAEHREQSLQRGLSVIASFWDQEQRRPRPRFVERAFRVHLGDNDWLTGRWDRVDEEDGLWAITDYKTSEVTSQDQANQRATESRQLVLYALALESTVGQRPARVSLDFLGSNLQGQARPQDRDYHRLRSDVGRAAQGIRQRHYDPKASYRACSGCAFRSYCDASVAR